MIVGFRELLESLLQRTSGAEGAFLMAFDGIPIEGVARGGGVDLEAAGTEYASLLKEAMDLNREMGLGRTKGVSILAERLSLCFVFPKDDYVLGLLVKAAGCAAKARYELRRSLSDAEKDL